MPNEAIAGWALGMRMREQRLAEESRKAQAERLRDLDQRAESLQGLQTLRLILDPSMTPRERKPLMDYFEKNMAARYNVDMGTLGEWLKGMDEEHLREVQTGLDAVGVKIGQGDVPPDVLLKWAKNPFEAVKLGVELFKGKQEKATKEEASKVFGAPMPKDPGTAVPEGWQPRTRQDALDLLDRREQELTARAQQIAAMRGGELPEGAKRAFDTMFTRLKEERERLSPKEPGSEVGLAYRAAGGEAQAGRALGMMREGKEGQTLVERLADAEAAAKASPDDPTAQQRVTSKRFAYQKQGELEGIKTGARRDEMMMTPLSPKERSSMLHPATSKVPPPGLTRGQAITQGYIEVDDKDREALADLQKSKQQIGLLTTLAGKLITAETPVQATAQYARLTAGAMSGSNAAARTYQQTRDAFLGTLARSLGGERGVLTNQDIARIGSALTGFFDTKAVSAAKAEILNSLISVAESATKAKMFGEPLDEAAARRQIDELVERLEKAGGATAPASKGQSFTIGGKDIKVGAPR